ncbi:MAG: outer membrane protein assembly factor BamD [Proteobacteria bacterium]|nr:outer membrane protein assembly factor BamD [Pseudomonadota bacterium]
MIRKSLAIVFLATVVTACGSTTVKNGTLAELGEVKADLQDVYLDDSLERAAQSYRRYLEETSGSARTPEAMRRLADLQIEQAYGLMGDGEVRDMTTPEAATGNVAAAVRTSSSGLVELSESDREFEQRATQREEFLAPSTNGESELVAVDGEIIPAGPREAIETYKKILETYPNYERNDKVLYQMSRAYDEIGQPNAAMEVMNRFISEYPHSMYVDEVQFRRGEFHFVSRAYRDAEAAYKAVIRLGPNSSYYELSLYKMGWALYKQSFYDAALDNFIALLDYQKSIGYDFDQHEDDNEEHRVTDTFRVVSLSFSNLGGPEVVDEYFSEKGHRIYSDKIYSNLGEFYLTKLRFNDAASVYRSFIELNPYHLRSPHFGMRIVEIFDEAEFPLLVVEAKKDFATRYALSSEYWDRHDVASALDVTGFLKTNLTDLAGHYHALYQENALTPEKVINFNEAYRWYRQLLSSFPADEETPQINYQLADLLLENEDFGSAALEYELTAYEYGDHEQASSAGYAAVFAYRQQLDRVTGARRHDVKELTVESSLRFADTFMEHDQAPVVLGAAAKDLYEMKDFVRSIDSASKLIERYPASDPDLRRAAWAVVAHSSIDTAEYQNAEHAYANVLKLTPEDDESRPAVIDGLAASIYKQAEQANLLADYRAAANHFLRIKVLAPTSSIRTSAEYDAAAALMKLQDWTMAADVLEEFRTSHPEHELHNDATKQLAHIYREDGQLARSAAEHERISIESGDIELSREALLTAGDLYDEAKAMADAVRVYEQYVEDYPRPIDYAVETRKRLSEIFEEQLDYQRYFAQLAAIVTVDSEAGVDRTDRSRYVAAGAALVLAEQLYQQFAGLKLVQPFEASLAQKQMRMDAMLTELEKLVQYEVTDVTAAATYYIAETYREFSTALMESERPEDLSAAEMGDYELLIEEEAWPFEERAIEVHEANFELLATGIYNSWVQKSLDELAVMMPGRYAKNESSEGFLGSIDVFAYRMPVATEIDAEGEGVAETDESRPAKDDATRASALAGLVSRN